MSHHWSHPSLRVTHGAACSPLLSASPDFSVSTASGQPPFSRIGRRSTAAQAVQRRATGFPQPHVRTGGTNRTPLASAACRFSCPRHGSLVPLLPLLPHPPLEHQQEHLLVLQTHRLLLQCQAARRTYSVVVQSEQPVGCRLHRLLHDPRHHEEVPVVQTLHQPVVVARCHLIEDAAHDATRRDHQGKGVHMPGDHMIDGPRKLCEDARNHSQPSLWLKQRCPCYRPCRSQAPESTLRPLMTPVCCIGVHVL